jgi:hypothetical protein
MLTGYRREGTRRIDLRRPGTWHPDRGHVRHAELVARIVDEALGLIGSRLRRVIG